MAKTTEQPVAETPATGKGHATPTRKEQEAARKQPLVSSDRAEARRKARAQMQLEREKDVNHVRPLALHRHGCAGGRRRRAGTRRAPGRSRPAAE